MPSAGLATGPRCSRPAWRPCATSTKTLDEVAKPQRTAAPSTASGPCRAAGQKRRGRAGATVARQLAASSGKASCPSCAARQMRKAARTGPPVSTAGPAVPAASKAPRGPSRAAGQKRKATRRGPRGATAGPGATSRGGKRPSPKAPAGAAEGPKRLRASVDETVGPVTESKEAHLRRHNGGLYACPRCRWYMFGSTWITNYGCLDTRGTGPREKVVWLAERPQRWGGNWGLGCALCAGQVHRHRWGEPHRPCPRRDAGQGARSRPGSRFATRWSRYEVRAETLQASHIAQHGSWRVHKLAEQMFLRPDEPVLPAT